MYQINFIYNDNIAELLYTAEFVIAGQNSRRSIYLNNRVRMAQLIDIFKEYQIEYEVEYTLD